MRAGRGPLPAHRATRPNAVTAPVHHRMPVMLDEADYEAWLGNVSLDKALRVLEPYPDDEQEAYPASCLINVPANDVPMVTSPMLQGEQLL